MSLECQSDLSWKGGSHPLSLSVSVLPLDLRDASWWSQVRKFKTFSLIAFWALSLLPERIFGWDRLFACFHAKYLTYGTSISSIGTKQRSIHKLIKQETTWIRKFLSLIENTCLWRCTGFKGSFVAPLDCQFSLFLCPFDSLLGDLLTISV